MTQDTFDAICEWEFIERSGKTVTVRMGRPIFDPKTEGWGCESEIVGLAQGTKYRARGTDPFQAVIMAMERFRVIFEQEEGSYTSPPGGSSPYFVFPRYIPTVYGTDVHERITKLVEREIQKVEDEWTRRWEESQRKRNK
ncbi:hypothetical protein SAMN05444161_5984 [Rhizobiales bacterium GAS191]|jgi:hypothetical protein|nr:hypothetical protein SAMN05519103_05154 [Rhizobiales bacterium GAS113]SEE50613.1 hypothetical protein SAMN05444161_5984 [Rhizobiales bacterium GAS191]